MVKNFNDIKNKGYRVIFPFVGVRKYTKLRLHEPINYSNPRGLMIPQ